LCQYLQRDWFCHQVLPSSGEKKELFIWSFKAVGDDKYGHWVDLAINLSIEDSTLFVTVFSPFWMINKTCQELVYKLDEDRKVIHPSSFNEPILVCFKSKSFFSKKKASLAIDSSSFSDDFSMDVIGSRGNVITKSRDGKQSYCVSVGITLAQITLSKIVTISSFYSIINSKSIPIQISEGNDEWINIDKLSSNPFWPTTSKNPVIFIRTNSSSCASKAIPITHSLSCLIQADMDYYHFDIDVSEYQVLIKISDYFDGAAPVLLINNLNNHTIYYGQSGVRYRFELPPLHNVLYTWNDLSLKTTFGWSIDKANENEVDLTCDAFGDVESTKQSNNPIFWVSFLDSKQRILLITQDLSIASNALHVMFQT